METLYRDLKDSVRALAQAPGFTAVVVLTLGLGIGANAAIFSVVNALILRPMPVKDPAHITVITAVQLPDRDQPGLVSYLDYLDYRAASDAFEDMAAARVGLVGLSAETRADRIMVSYVTSNYFSMFGIEPAVGRLIRRGEGDAIGSDPIIVLGHTYWKRRFGGNPGVVGGSVRVNGRAYTIVGVVPESFLGAAPFIEMDAYVPMGMAGLEPGRRDAFTRRDDHKLRVYGRLKSTSNVEGAQASLDVIARRLERQYPDTNTNVGVRVFPEVLARPEPSFAQLNSVIVTVFLTLAGVVLLVACVNVTNLFLARTAARERELRIRAALGASRARLARHLMTEIALLAIGGGGAGIVIGTWASSMLGSIRLPTEAIPVRFDFSMDWRGVGYAAVAAMSAAIGVGTPPAIRGSRADIHDVVRDQGWASALSGGRHRLRSILVVAQIAASVVLLVVAGLFVRSLGYAHRLELGFRPDGVLNVSMDPAQLGYDEARGRQFFRDLKDRVKRLPGVQSVTSASSVPLGYSVTCEYVDVEGRVIATGERRPTASCTFVDPDYFATMGVTLLQGRHLTEHDTEKAMRVAIVNETMARGLWPGVDAIGKRFSYTGAGGPWLTVVGVARNGKYDFLFERPAMYFYAPLEQNYRSARTLHVLALRIDPSALGPAVQKEVRAFDPDLPTYDVQSMMEALQGGNGFFLPRIGAGFAAALGGLGLLLATIGVYGVVSYTARQRTPEIGMRIALGATPFDVLSMILRQGAVLLLLGVGVGLAASLVAGRAVAALLYGISPVDSLTFAGVSVVLTIVVLAACWLPARRAARIDPLRAIREV